MNSSDSEKRSTIIGLLFPLAFVITLWIIKYIEVATESDFSGFALYPLNPKGLIGIVTGPLIHADWKHLANNSLPLLFLSWAVFYFYRDIAFKVFFLTYFLSQTWLWFFYVRAGGHIGASGLIYGFGAFVFVSGIIRKNRNLLAISLLVAFLYGSMVWGVFPYEERISWEGHLMGFITGIILAFYYKDFGPPLPKDIFEDDEEEDLDEDYEENAYFDEILEEEDDNPSKNAGQ